MATTQKLMFRGQASTSSNTLYTVPSATSAVVTNIIVSNSGSTPQTFTLTLDGYHIASAAIIYGNSFVSFDIRQVLAAADEITGFASSANVAFHISGVEIA